MNEKYKKMDSAEAATEIHRIILEVYKGPNPSPEIVNAILRDRYGITLLKNGFVYSVKKHADGSLEVRCTFKAPAPDGKGFLGTFVE